MVIFRPLEEFYELKITSLNGFYLNKQFLKPKKLKNDLGYLIFSIG